MRRFWLLMPLLLLASFAVRPATAHPHVWVDSSLELEMDEGKVTGLAVTWRFDDFYSEMVRLDFDQNRDGSLSQKELDALVGISATSLSAHSFFTHLRVGDEQREVKAVKDFYAEDDGTQILYRFRIPLPEPIDVNETPFSIGFFDKGYYVDLTLADKNITVPDSACRMVPKEALDQPLYYGIFYPTYYHLACGAV